MMRFGTQIGARQFSSVAATSALYTETMKKAAAAYTQSKAAVDAKMNATLNENKVVLFMEGTPDAPKSELGLNVVKMLTEAQAVPLASVDVMAHPAIMGYAASKKPMGRFPHLYLNGSFFGDHDVLLGKYQSGELASIGTKSTLSSGYMSKGELPIASY